jgi:hypothetical protein
MEEGGRAMSELIKAAKRLLHLHACEQEGLSAGQPTPEQWAEAVGTLEALREMNRTKRKGAEDE